MVRFQGWFLGGEGGTYVESLEEEKWIGARAEFIPARPALAVSETRPVCLVCSGPANRGAPVGLAPDPPEKKFSACSHRTSDWLVALTVCFLSDLLLHAAWTTPSTCQ